MIEGSLEVKRPTIWTDEKQRWEESEKRREGKGREEEEKRIVLLQPLQYYLRDPAAKENRITHAATAPSNLDAAITMHFAASRRKPAHIYAHGNTR